jgi:hypothetical protein
VPTHNIEGSSLTHARILAAQRELGLVSDFAHGHFVSSERRALTKLHVLDTIAAIVSGSRLKPGDFAARWTARSPHPRIISST